MGMEARSRKPKIHLKPQYFEKADGLLKEYGIEPGAFLVGLGPGAMYGDAKRWPLERFAKIADFASENWKARVVTLGSGNEMEICEKICRLTKNKVYNFCGTTSLEEAVGIISLCGMFLTNDSGLMHISAALGIPTLAIFGSTDHVATGPVGEKTSIVRHDFECAPCLKHECPIDHRCMISIEPEEVWEEMKRMKEQTT
jgi:heptosyltransferase-2